MKAILKYQSENINAVIIQQNTEAVKAELVKDYRNLTADEVAVLIDENAVAQFKHIDMTRIRMVIHTTLPSDNEGNCLAIRIICREDNIFIACQNKYQSIDKMISKLTDFATPLAALIYLLNKTTLLIEKNICKLDEKLDDMEEALLDEINGDTRQLILVSRRQVIQLRRHLLPQREVLSNAASSVANHDKKLGRRLSSIQQRTMRFCDSLEAIRERLSLMQEELSAILNDRMNKNMYSLSIIATIFLPLGFITGLLGINVGGIPGVNNHMAFWLVTLGSLMIGCAILVYFKRRNWW